MAQIIFTRDLRVTDDNPKYTLLIIDPQIDFHKGGSLAVPHADEDAKVTANVILKNLDKIDEIFVTLDSHHKKHIAHKAFWEPMSTDKDNGNQKLKNFSQLSHIDQDDSCLYLCTEKGTVDQALEGWRPKDISLKNWAIEYSKKLAKGVNNFKLTIWPDHCLIGTEGHAINELIQKALSEWSRHPRNLNKTIKYITKGMNCLTEMYSAIEAEVPIVSDQSTMTNEELLFELGKTDKLLVCGQALSHCVNYTVRDIVKHWYGKVYKNQIEEGASKNCKKPNTMIENIFIIRDATSPVEHFEKAGEDFVKDMTKAGLKIVKADELVEIGLNI